MYVSHRIFERILRLTSVRQACLSVSVFSHLSIFLYVSGGGGGPTAWLVRRSTERGDEAVISISPLQRDRCFNPLVGRLNACIGNHLFYTRRRESLPF